jgi:hypothetical protein
MAEEPLTTTAADAKVAAGGLRRARWPTLSGVPTVRHDRAYAHRPHRGAVLTQRGIMLELVKLLAPLLGSIAAIALFLWGEEMRAGLK